MQNDVEQFLQEWTSPNLLIPNTQGDPLSCDLFNVIMKNILRECIVIAQCVQLFAYTDDIDIIGRYRYVTAVCVWQ